MCPALPAIPLPAHYGTPLRPNSSAAVGIPFHPGWTTVLDLQCNAHLIISNHKLCLRWRSEQRRRHAWQGIKRPSQRLTLMPYIYQSVSERCARPKRCRSSGPLRALMSRMRKSIPGGVFDRATASEQSGRSSAARQILAALSSRACSRTQLSTLTPRPSLGNVISLGRSYLDTRHQPTVAPSYIKERIHRSAIADAPG
jgi:hypothetical protein